MTAEKQNFFGTVLLLYKTALTFGFIEKIFRDDHKCGQANSKGIRNSAIIASMKNVIITSLQNKT